MKSISIKKEGKQGRERKVLLGLVDYFIKTGKPVGSNTLKEAGFEELSSATIRNYFAHLEQEQYLVQLHSSGGRVPTNLAYRVYAREYIEFDKNSSDPSLFKKMDYFNSREMASFLQECAEDLSEASQCAVLLSAPRFDHDFVVDLKLVLIDVYRCLAIIITDFGVVQTEMLQLPTKMSTFAIKRIESYFQWRLKGIKPPEHLDPEEEVLGRKFYNEVMVRYIVGYSNFIDEEVYRTGFSHLLNYSEFHDAAILASSLSLFENSHSVRLLLKDCVSTNKLKFWIGEDLTSYMTLTPQCSVLAIPYYINQKPVGAVGILGPTRMPYKKLFNVLRSFSKSVSEALTRNIYKFKISFRQPQTGTLYLQNEEQHLLGQSSLMLLEDKRLEQK